MTVRLPVEQIRQAREAAVNQDFAAYEIDWQMTNSDKRHGAIHAWTAERTYLGQFTTHDRALARNAAVTRIGQMWFLWQFG